MSSMKDCFLKHIWGCTGFDGLRTFTGCMSRLTDESRKSFIMDNVIDNNYSYRLAA